MVQPRRSARAAAAAATATAAIAATAPQAKSTPTKKGGKKGKSSPSKLQGLGGEAAPSTDAPLGTVDPQSGFGKSAVIVQGDDGVQYDAMLNLLDLSQNSDKYYILQVVSEKKGRKVLYHCYSRWGRTGTAGTCQIFTDANVQEAIDKFEDKFQEKTGQRWCDRDNFVQQSGKYKLLKNAATRGSGPQAPWQYYVDDGVDGKANGWYDYEAEGSDMVEDLFLTFLTNPEMNTRVVDSGHFSYVVDLTKGTQTNMRTKRTRAIRRNTATTTTPGQDATAAAAATGQGTPAGKKRNLVAAAAAAVPSTPPPSKRQKAQSGPTTPAPPTTPTPSKGKKSPASAPPSKTKAAAANWVSGADLVSAMGSGSVDPTCPKSGTAFLVAGYDVMLNQTDIRANKNKFYLIQLMYENGSDCYVWTRWGRVGEIGMSQMLGPLELDEAKEEYAKKFKLKTGNDWANRKNFVVKAGKYELVEIEAQPDETPSSTPASAARPLAAGNVACKLDPATKSLVDLIFNEDMFKDAMSALDLDVNRIPLGRLSKAQVQKGMDILADIEETVKNGQSTVQLSSRFYQVIPHSCGRKQPPAITSLADVQSKFDLLNVLGDIEVAQDLMKGGDAQGQLHPSDARYQQLQADVSLLTKNSQEFKVLETYLQNTRFGGAQVDNIWRVDRHGESSRFQPYASITNRKLLWHGTNIAVVAAILKSGLRIMPHSGGRVGRGIYLASECAKSQSYVRGTSVRGKYLGIMFLVEAALGKEHHITKDDSSLKKPPPGFDSVVAMGSKEPDPKEDTTLTFDGLKVAVPQGKPIQRPSFLKSYFRNSEYLVYEESQHRIRYVLTLWL